MFNTNIVINDKKLLSFIDKCQIPGVNIVNGLYVANVMSLNLDFGPAGNLPQTGARIWDTAWFFGYVVSILAHGHLDGKFFFDVKPSDIIYLVLSNKKISRYQVTQIDLWHNDSDWEQFSQWNGRDVVSSHALSARYHLGGQNYERLVLQTCIGNQDGVLFVVANQILENHP